MVVYALNLWGPTYFIRTFEYSRPEAGWVFGLVMILAGTFGLLTAGLLSDKLMARGIHDAYIRMILFSMLAIMPCAIALGFIENDKLAIVAMAFAIYFSAFQLEYINKLY